MKHNISFNHALLYRYIAILITGLLLASCDQDNNSAQKPKKKMAQVNVIKVQARDVLHERKFNAVISAPNTIKISNQIAGTLIALPHRPGTVVKKGDLLVKLDDRLTRAEYQKAAASLDKAKQDLERIKKLVPSQLASAEQLTSAETDLKLAQAELTLKQIQLERSSISAPFDGVISERLYEPGDTLTNNQHLLTLVDIEHLIASSAVPEDYLAFVKRQQPIQLRIPALGYTFKGEITRLYPTVDQTTQQVSIEIAFDSEGNELFPGLFAEVLISHTLNNVILIPVNSVQYDNLGTWVYNLDDKNKAQKTRIKAGRNIGSEIEVVSGLTENMIVVTKGFVGLRSGKKVAVADDQNAPVVNK